MSGGPAIQIDGDERLLRRLFRNLLENARQHGGAGPIDVAVCGGLEAIITIRDQGPGISASEQAHLFEPFFRLRRTPDDTGGTGLGLSLARQIARKHDGDAEYVERKVGGACFQVKLPQPEGADSFIAEG